MKDWDYSILSHNANVHGGPEKYIDTIKEQVRQTAIKVTGKTCQKAIKATDKRWFKRTLLLAPFTAVGLFTIAQKTTTTVRSHLDKNIIEDKEAKENSDT